MGEKVVKSILHISSGLVILLSSFPLVSDAQWVQTQGPYGGPGGTLACKGSTVFLASGWGVFRSSDVGATWTATNLNLVVCDSELYAGTSCRGIWKRPISEMITAVSISVVGPPAHFGLGQNYPNPFNPSTTIRYTVPSRTHVVLSVFNTLGHQVATLVNGTEEAGYHTTRLDGTGLASGLYVYRLRSGSFVQSCKMLLVK